MIKRTVVRLSTVAVVAAAAFSNGVAFAESNEPPSASWALSESQVGSEGASLKLIRAYVDGSGKACFEEMRLTAGRNGASSRTLRTSAG